MKKRNKLMIKNTLLIFALIMCIYSSYGSQNLDSRLSELYNKLPNCEFTVTSGLRTIEHNKKIGGAPNSYHLHDRARDITSSKACRSSLEALAQKEGLTTIRYSKHVHIDDRASQKCLVKVATGFDYCDNKTTGNI